jgi:hypothetical protein
MPIAYRTTFESNSATQNYCGQAVTESYFGSRTARLTRPEERTVFQARLRWYSCKHKHDSKSDTNHRKLSIQSLDVRAKRKTNSPAMSLKPQRSLADASETSVQIGASLWIFSIPFL